VLLAGGIACILGLLCGAFGIVAALFGGGASISPGAVGAALGILGYFLGSRRLGTVTVLLCVAALFFGLAASQGLIPGIDAFDRTLPANEPAAE
jgi:VIT1/CCC1 family predicted Fe2+/Mn2+ transporter